MPISPLYAGALGDPLNSTGTAIASTVNSIIAAVESATIAAVPAQPTVNLDFVNNNHKVYGEFGPTLTPITTVLSTTRSTTATYETPTSLATSGINTPRVAYNQTTGECLGLLGEALRTNILLQSEAIGTSPWTLTAATVSNDATLSPALTMTADKLIETAVNSTHLTRQTVTLSASTNYSLTVHLKASERKFATILVLDNASNISSTHVNLETGIVATGATSLASVMSIQLLQNGWYKVTVTFTSTAAPSGAYVDVRMSDVWPIAASTGTSYLGDGASGMFVWGWQLEAGILPTSYIPTTTAQVTRTADVIKRTLSQVNSNAGTIYIDFDITSYEKIGNTTTIVKLGDAANTVLRGFGLTVTNDTFTAYLRNASFLSLAISVTVADSLLPQRVAISFDNRLLTISIAVNGVTNTRALPQAIDISGLAGDLYVSGGERIFGNPHPHSKTVKVVKYFPRAMTVAELQVLTS